MITDGENQVCEGAWFVVPGTIWKQQVLEKYIKGNKWFGKCTELRESLEVMKDSVKLIFR